MVCFTLLLTKLGQLCGVGTISAPYHNHHIHLACQLDSRRLALICSGADSSQNPYIRGPLQHLGHNLSEFCSRKGCLGYNTQPAIPWQSICFLLSINSNRTFSCPFQNTAYLRMILISYNNHLIPIICQLLGSTLSLSHMRTGSIHQSQPLFLYLCIDMRANTMRTDNYCARLNLIQ